MKKIVFFMVFSAMLSMVSCDLMSKSEADEKRKAELADSLSVAMAEKDSLFSLLGEVSETMLKIKDAEKLMSSNISQETPDQREQLKNDLQLLQQALQSRRERLEELEKKLRKSVNYNAEMKKTIEGLRSQIQSQQTTIEQLTADLQMANAKIRSLNVTVDSLNIVNENVNKAKDAALEEAENLTNRLNECYYVVGSKKELKNNKVIETGFLKKTKLMQSDFEKGYFTKADKRNFSSLNLHSKKAKVLSNHPKGSYAIEEQGGVKVLVINDAKKFWELSNYLVVQID